MRVLPIVMRTFLVTLLCSTMALGESVVVNKGVAAPFTGILFPEQDAQALRVKVIERDYFEGINKSLEKSLSIVNGNYNVEQEKVHVLVKQNDKLAVALQDSRSMSDWTKVLYFGLGVAAVVLGGVVVKSLK